MREIPYHLPTVTYYLLYSSIDYNYCFGNKRSRCLKGQANSSKIFAMDYGDIKD